MCYNNNTLSIAHISNFLHIESPLDLRMHSTLDFPTDEKPEINPKEDEQGSEDLEENPLCIAESEPSQCREDSKTSSPNKTETSETSHQCPLCSAKFDSVDLLVTHLRTVHRTENVHILEQPTNSPTTLPESPSGKALRPSNKEAGYYARLAGPSVLLAVRCSQCPFKTQNSSRLNKHMKMHKSNPQRQHRCQYCNFYAANLGSLSGHEALHNKKTSPRKQNNSQSQQSTNSSQSVDKVISLRENYGLLPKSNISPSFRRDDSLENEASHQSTQNLEGLVNSSPGMQTDNETEREELSCDQNGLAELTEEDTLIDFEPASHARRKAELVAQVEMEPGAVVFIEEASKRLDTLKSDSSACMLF